MRLSELLNKAPDKNIYQVENFLGFKRYAWGRTRNIKVGIVFRNYYCEACRDYRSFQSKGSLSCLIVNESTVSIDIALRCPGCDAGREAWFLLRTTDSLYAPSPHMRLKRYAEMKVHSIGDTPMVRDEVQFLLAQAQVAYNAGLGAGAMVYLRKAYEIITTNAAQAIDVSTTTVKGRRKPFKKLLQEVDDHSEILPREYSENRYTLFSELSDVLHGSSNESDALDKYDPCRKLILGIVKNIRSREEFNTAKHELGWS